MTYQSLNPATGKLLKKFDELTDKQLESKLATASRTASRPGGARAMPSERSSSQRPPTLMHDKADELAHIMTLEMGKRISEARGEVEFSSTILAYYAKNAERFLAHV